MQRPARSPAEAFVDVTAKLSLLMAGLSVAWSLLQLLVVAALGRLDPVAWLQRQGLPVPAAVQWMAGHALALSLLLVLLSVALLLVSWALLRRRGWGRTGFIVFLVVVAAGNFALLPLIDSLFSAMHAFLPADFLASPDGREALAQFQASRWTALLSAGATAVAFAALHAWLVARLCRADVRALFH
ncbi:hypothetical protein [Stenotrophomonas mori]|uniref:DUF1772 domain-containing protein n=1 Tax=Stenotrophomonas mori TaxID=2871096 RepID=A0ABT0SID4_9GAMM|nr:hypothetical protein [Stenotrophomonas mori]MCL7714694.1 hypothetical protein [Stenotrophomonas mori]